jgi:Zinc metalloprotease (elastase)
VSMADGFNGSAYVLQDTTRGGGNYAINMGGRQTGGSLMTNSTNTWGDGVLNSSNPNTAAADAYYGLQLTWDFYKNTLGRNGIDGAGKQTYSRVHYGRNYENAFWSDSCFCMTYGDGATTFYPLVSIDVAGHERSHGVMSREAALTYSGESGGLNEANSDMMGTMVEFSANSPKDTPDWWIGEIIYKSNYSTGTYVQSKALRYMDQPSKDGRSPNCWSSTLGSLDVHYSSGPANHMFYLLAHGGTSACTGNTVAGLGNAAATRIWYTAVRDYMTASTNYAGAKAACLKAAANSSEQAAVTAAFAAINVN